MHYNPFYYIHSEKDILKLVNTLIANTKGEGEKSSEDFWVKVERLLYCALIGYIYYECPESEQNFSMLLDILGSCEAREDDENFKSETDELFENLEAEKPDHFAVRQYRKFKMAAGYATGKTAWERQQVLTAHMACPEVPERIHPHIFRHSRAMHLYQHGMDLTMVSQWLGHANLSTTLMHLFYGVSMLDRYKGTGWKKFYLIFGMCDESFSINYTAEIPEDADRGWFMFFVTLLNHFYWFSGATLGGIFGSLIHFNTEGLDFVMTAMFVVIFMEQWMKEKRHTSALAGVGLSLLCLLVFGAERFIIPAMAAILAVLTGLRGRLEQKEAEVCNSRDDFGPLPEVPFHSFPLLPESDSSAA